MPADSKSPLVLVEQLGGGICRLQLNDPNKLNAMSEPMAEQFAEAVSSLRQDEQLRALIVTGAGKAFSAGGNLEMLLEKSSALPEENVRAMQQFYHQFLAVRSLDVPIIAAVNGLAVGGGACLALACDLRIASQKAKFGFNFVRLGLHPGMGATYFLPRLIGLPKASELLLSGEALSAKQAFDLHVVNAVVEHRQLSQHALNWAQKIARQAPQTIRLLVKTLRESLESDYESCLAREASCQAIGYQSSEFQEGVQAAREKRDPRF